MYLLVQKDIFGEKHYWPFSSKEEIIKEIINEAKLIEEFEIFELKNKIEFLWNSKYFSLYENIKEDNELNRQWQEILSKFKRDEDIPEEIDKKLNEITNKLTFLNNERRNETSEKF